MPTVTIDEDVFLEAQRIASQQQQTVDEVISSASRSALKSRPVGRPSDAIPFLPVRDTTPVTLEFVNELREEFGG